jgi:hypothetical protein
MSEKFQNGTSTILVPLGMIYGSSNIGPNFINTLYIDFNYLIIIIKLSPSRVGACKVGLSRWHKAERHIYKFSFQAEDE